MKKFCVLILIFCLAVSSYARHDIIYLCQGEVYYWDISEYATSGDTLVYASGPIDWTFFYQEAQYDTVLGNQVILSPSIDRAYKLVSINGSDTMMDDCPIYLTIHIKAAAPTISIPPDLIKHVTCPDGAHPNGSFYPYMDGSFHVRLNDSVQNYAWIQVEIDTPFFFVQTNYDSVTLSSLRSGTYYVVAHGINGCEYHDSVTIEQPDPWVDLGCLFDTVCSGQTGCIQLELYGGTPPYSFTWFYLEQDGDVIDTIFLEDTTRLACGLEAGGKIYLTYMYDSRGCKFLGDEIEVIFSYLYEYIEDSTHIITTNPITCYGSPFLAQAQSIGYGDYVWHVGDSVDSVNWWTWVAADSVLIAEYNTPSLTEATLVSVDFYDQHGCVTHDSVWVNIYNPETSLTIETAEITTDSTFVVHVSPPGGSLYIDNIFIAENIPETYTLSTTGFLVGEHILRYYGIFGGELDLQCEDEISIPFQIQSHPFVTAWDQEISIYPNPATTVLNLSSTEMMDFSISITDITGRVIMREKIMDLFYPVDVSNLTPGIYLLHLETLEGASKSIKFVKR